MATPAAEWSREKNAGFIDPNEKLFVFGYSCKLFRDDEKSMYIDQGKHLIPWMGDKTHMIDRYDVRGYLHNLKEYEPKPEGYEDPLSDEESLCDEERYRSLRKDMSEEQLYHEEELKRLRAAIAGDGAYCEVGFAYDNAAGDNYDVPEAPKEEEPEDELYEIPEGLTVPKGIEVPYTMKIHAIMEKTALFVSKQGGQMEIIIKMKQHANPQFAFMHLDNPLHPYYKHLVKEIKSGAYKPVEIKQVVKSEDEDDDEHYLHPSLMAGKAESAPKFTVPNINFRRSSDDSYSVLVRNLQQQFAEKQESPPTEDQNEVPEDNGNYPENALLGMFPSDFHIVPPPPDLQPIVDKMAEYVAKNGDDFEFIVKSKNDKRFDFLQSWHEYYKYYVHKRDTSKAMILSEQSSNPNDIIYIPSHLNSIVKESGPILYSHNNSSSKPNGKSRTAIKKDLEVICSQDSQDGTHFAQSSKSKDENSSDSLDFLNSPKAEDTQDEHRTKPLKVHKGPISFSLKLKDNETPSDKTKLNPSLLYDSEDDESSEEGKTEKEKEESARRRKEKEELKILQNSRTNAAEDGKATKQSSEVLEAKQAEERRRDKLIATCRERLAQQRKEKQQLLEQQKREEQLKKEKQQQLDQQRKDKQLQLERKKKAELFLKMLKQKNPDSTAVVSHILGSEKNNSSGNVDFWSLPDTTSITSPNSGILFHGDKVMLSTTNFPSNIPGIKTEWSSDEASQHSGIAEPISIIGEKLSSESETNTEPAPSKAERKKKRKKRSRSKSREKSSKSSRHSKHSRHRSRSKSPPRSYREKPKKEKELPAAYALNKRSRSRSRSPRRYRPAFSYWNRRR